MASHDRTAIADQLSAARLAISNTLADDELLSLVAAYGYGAARLGEGQRLYDAAVAAVDARVAASGAARLATAQAHAAERRAWASYQALAQLARAVFQHEPARSTTLGLVGHTPRGTSGFLAAAGTLFANALGVAPIGATLADYGYDAARLERELAVVRAFDQAYRAQVVAFGAARRATSERRAALAALSRWVAQYLKIARIALRDQPTLIEKLGIGAV